MEYLIAFLALSSTVGFALLIAVNIEKGKTWAIEIAQAVSVLDPGSFEHNLQHRTDGERTVAAPVAVAKDAGAKPVAGDERMAA